MLTEDVFESGDLELLSEEEVMEINGGCGNSARGAATAGGAVTFGSVGFNKAMVGAKKGAKAGTMAKAGVGTLAGAVVGGAIGYTAYQIGK